MSRSPAAWRGGLPLDGEHGSSRSLRAPASGLVLIAGGVEIARISPGTSKVNANDQACVAASPLTRSKASVLGGRPRKAEKFSIGWREPPTESTSAQKR